MHYWSKSFSHMVILCSQEIYWKGKTLWLLNIFNYAFHSTAPSEKLCCNMDFLEQQPKNISYRECLFMARCIISASYKDTAFCSLCSTNMKTTFLIFCFQITVFGLSFHWEHELLITMEGLYKFKVVKLFDLLKMLKYLNY